MVGQRYANEFLRTCSGQVSIELFSAKIKCPHVKECGPQSQKDRYVPPLIIFQLYIKCRHNIQYESFIHVLHEENINTELRAVFA